MHQTIFTIFSFILLGPWSYAQKPLAGITNTNPLIVEKILITPQPFPAGANGEITVDVKLPENHFAYKDKLTFEIHRPLQSKVSSPSITPLAEFTDPLDKTTKKGIRDKATLKAIFELDENLKSGKHDLELTIKYQACTRTYCLFPTKLKKTITIDVVNESLRHFSKRPASVAEEKSELSQWFEKGALFAFIFVFFGGVLTSLTPCIFPMLPVTLAVLGASGRNKSRLSRLGLSISYVLGIAVMYSTMGVIAASTGALFGSTMQNPWVVGVIAVVFTLMSLAMFGVWEFQVPSFLRNRLANKKTGTGHVGAFFTGAIAGIVASPCVGPVLFSILAYVAQSQDIFLGFALLFVFALGLGQIFILIGLFSELLEKLPRAGVWMNSINFVFGALMLGTAVYFLQFVIPQNWIWVTAGAAIMLTGGVYGFHLSFPRIKPYAYLAVFIGLCSVGYGSHLILNDNPPTETSAKNFNWIPYSEEAVKAARGSNVMIDFYADWCVACKEFEKITFPHPEVKKRLDKMKLIKVDATEVTEEIEAVLQKYGVLGLPTLIFLDKEGNVLKDITTTGFEDGPTFLKRLNKIQF